jgi:hypothetical protein
MEPNVRWKRKYKKYMNESHGIDTLLTVLQAERLRLEELQLSLEKEMRWLPPGKVIYKEIEGRRYCYLGETVEDPARPGHFINRQRLLGNKERKLRESLCRKRQITELQPILRENHATLERCIAHYIPVSVWPKLFEPMPEKLIPKSRRPIPWERKPFESNPYHPEGLIHVTQSGRRVRSKSEAIIAGLLEVHQIPFRYEARLDLGGRHVYPDFTIQRNLDGAIFYWEHFGMTENSEYVGTMEEKMAAYRQAGITPWNELITTYDRSSGSLDVRMIESLMRSIFL